MVVYNFIEVLWEIRNMHVLNDIIDSPSTALKVSCMIHLFFEITLKSRKCNGRIRLVSVTFCLEYAVSSFCIILVYLK